MVVTLLEWILIALVVFGIVPAWLIGLAAFISSKQRREAGPSARFFAYVKLLEVINPKREGSNFVIDNGAIYAAAVRELKSYPEFADLSLLLLEEINITGTKKFDGVMKAEIQTVEAFLLERHRGQAE